MNPRIPENTGQAEPLRVVLVEDQPDTRDSWQRLISAFPDFTCMDVFATAEDALREIPAIRPDVILMDIFLPQMSGIECTAKHKSSCPDIPIVMLTASDEDEILFQALENGADGYLLKRTKPAELRAALLDVLDGGAPMSSEIARHVVRSFRRGGSADKAHETNLTAREEETLALLTKGYSNKEIADSMGLSIETIRSHLKNIYTKMHVRSRTEAVLRYMTQRNG